MIKIPTRGQKLKELKKKLQELEDVKLKEALTRYGEAFQETSAPGESAVGNLPMKRFLYCGPWLPKLNPKLKPSNVRFLNPTTNF